MMSKPIDKKVYSDLLVIFNMMSTDMLKKINHKFIEAIKKNASSKYKSDINPNIPLRKQKISKETEAFLSIIYRVYFQN